MPRMASNVMPMMNGAFLPTRNGMGLFGRIANSIKTFNWNGLLNGANKTLNVVNQTIPLVRQAGPLFNNMKSMMRIARAFGSETNNMKNNTRKVNDNNSIEPKNNIEITESINNDNSNSKNEIQNDNYPNFFV